VSGGSFSADQAGWICKVSSTFKHSLYVHAERAQVAGEFEAADLVRREQPGGAAADRRHDADFGIEPHRAGGHAELFGDGVGGQHAGLVVSVRHGWSWHLP
jgi:hypothetical protein